MGHVHTQSDTLDRLKQLIRRDLKLPSTTPIPDDMSLVGGQMDLDSLDILLVLTSAEKEFGITITAQNDSPNAFANLASFAAFIDSRRSTDTPAIHSPRRPAPADLSSKPSTPSPQPAAAPYATLLASHGLQGLPHQPPFRFVTRYTPIVPGNAGLGEWQLTGDEPFFAGHFPGQPLVPGVLISEALAQVSGLVVGSNHTPAQPRRIMMLAEVNVKFREPVTPPATLMLSSSLARTMGDLLQFDVAARVSGQIVAQGSITLAAGPARPA